MENLKICSYNLRYEERGDGKNMFSYRSMYIRDAIRRESPDIIGFQEVLPHMQNWLRDTFPEYITVGCGRGSNYQGESNPVNQEIRHTLNTSLLRDKFVLLNNGVTIVTKHFKSLGSNMFELREFQVVNGCQTSHEIYAARAYARDILVPVKIIHTTDADVISMIVKSTNRQTPVPTEAFVALETYHKHLQQVFEEYSKEMPLPVFYERRSGELALKKASENCYEVATLHSIIRSATSVYFQEPYIVYNNNPANILKNRYNKLFQEEQPCEIYYLSYYLFANFLELSNINKSVFNGFVYKLRFYIIMVARCILANTSTCPAMNSKDMKAELR